MSESQQYTESEVAGRPRRSPGGAATRNRDAARPANSAAWLRKRRGTTEVGPASYTPPRIRVQMVNGATLRANEVSKAVYEDFLPAARAAGQYQAVPGPRVVSPDAQQLITN